MLTKKRLILTAVAVALIAALALFSVLPLQAGASDNSGWMNSISDETPLSAISIPGTHDSGALHSIADATGKCQTLSIKEQLKIGVRFLDIRLQLVSDNLVVVHSIVDQMTDFEDVLRDMEKFLEENPSELLLVSIKEDADSKGSEREFREVLEEMLLSSDAVSRATELPETVGAGRGMIHIISRYSGATIGLPCYHGWTDDDSFEISGIYVQDNYKLDTTEEKISDIEKALEVSKLGEYDLVLNYTSCYLTTSFPPIYAGVPAHEINRWVKGALAQGNEPTGVMVMDFITSDIANIIIGRNAK